MTAAVAHILDEFEQLTPDERVELRRRIVESVPMSDEDRDLQADLEASAADEAAGRLHDAEEVMAALAEKFGLTPSSGETA